MEPDTFSSFGPVHLFIMNLTHNVKDKAFLKYAKNWNMMKTEIRGFVPTTAISFYWGLETYIHETERT